MEGTVVGYSTELVSGAVKAVREAHRAGTLAIDAELEKAVAFLRLARWADGGPVHEDELDPARTRSMHVRITQQNVAVFFVHEAPKTYENREALETRLIRDF